MSTRPISHRTRDVGLSGWAAIVMRVKNAIFEDRVGLIAAGVAYYGILALFPAITAMMAVAGLFVSPSDVADQIESISRVLPERAAGIIIDQATAVAGSRDGGLGLAAIFGLLLAFFSASRGVANLIEGLNIAYDTRDRRGFIRFTLTTFAMTVLLVFGLVAGLTAVLVLPGILSILQIGDIAEQAISALRWILLFTFTMLGISALYRFGPDRRAPKWSQIMPGAITACVLWLLGSLGFSLYAENFGSYQETFGSLAGAIVLLFWLWISAYVILLGAELNAELEEQTRVE